MVSSFVVHKTVNGENFTGTKLSETLGTAQIPSESSDFLSKLAKDTKGVCELYKTKIKMQKEMNCLCLQA